MTENKNHWVPTWMTPATVSRQSKALCERLVSSDHGRIGASPAHIGATTLDYGLLHDNPVHVNVYENHPTVMTRGKKPGAHMLSMPDAEEVLPRRRNHGLKPSEERLEMMR